MWQQEQEEAQASYRVNEQKWEGATRQWGTGAEGGVAAEARVWLQERDGGAGSSREGHTPGPSGGKRQPEPQQSRSHGVTLAV